MTTPTHGSDDVPEAVTKDLAARQEALALWLWLAVLARVGQAVAGVALFIASAPPSPISEWMALVFLGLLVCMVVGEAICYRMAWERCDADTASAALGRTVYVTRTVAALWLLLAFLIGVTLNIWFPGIDELFMALLLVAIFLHIAQQAYVLGLCRELDLTLSAGSGTPMPHAAPRLALLALVIALLGYGVCAFDGHASDTFWPLLFCGLTSLLWLLTTVMLMISAHRIGRGVPDRLEESGKEAT